MSADDSAWLWKVCLHTQQSGVARADHDKPRSAGILLLSMLSWATRAVFGYWLLVFGIQAGYDPSPGKIDLTSRRWPPEHCGAVCCATVVGRRWSEERTVIDKDRVRRTIEHRETYPVPYRLKFVQDVARMLSQLLHLRDVDGSIGNALVHLKMTSQPIPPRVTYPYGDLDEFGCVWVTDQNGSPYVVGHPLQEGDIDLFPFPDPLWPGRFEAMARQAAAEKDRFVLFSLEWSFFERAHFLCGLEKFLVDMLLETARVERLLDRILAFNLAVIEQACQLPIDGVILGDDYGTQNGLMMNPKHWRRFFKPGLRRQFELIKRYGKAACLHSCGDISTIVPDLIEVGLEVLNPLQPEVLDLPRLKQEYGKDLCFYGGISTQVTLPFGTPKEVRAEVRNRIEVLGKGGGYIIAPGIIVLADTPQENVLALLDAVRNQDIL